MDKETEGLLNKLGTAAAAEQDFERTKLKIQLRQIMAIDNLAESIGKLSDQLVAAYQCSNNSGNS